MNSETKKLSADEMVAALSEYPDEALVAILGVAANVRQFRERMRLLANQIEPLAALDGLWGHIEDLRRIALLLAIEQTEVPDPVSPDTNRPSGKNQAAWIETASKLKVQDTPHLALMLVEGARSPECLRELDYFQSRLYSLAGTGTLAERERIYHLRLICGLLLATVGTPGFCKRYGTGFEKPDGWL